MTGIGGLTSRFGNLLGRTDDGKFMRLAFYGLLSLSVGFLVVDMEELRSLEPAEPPEFLTENVPMLAPALSDGSPEGMPFELSSDPADLRKPIRFELQAGGILLADGAINVGAADRFREEIEARGEYVQTVRLNSPGGSVEDALAMSSLIRERKLATHVVDGALCASSCPLVFAGGVSRTAGAEAIFGVHQVFNGSADRPSAEQAMSTAQSMTARVSRHLEEMGIASGLWLHALETPPDRLYFLKPEEMKALGLVTGAEVPMASG